MFYDVVRWRARPPGGSWSAKRSASTARRLALRKARKLGGPWQLEDHTGKLGPKIAKLSELRTRLRRRMRAAPTGESVTIHTADGALRLAKVIARLRAPDTGGNAKIDVIVARLNERFSGGQLWGTIACRNVGSTATKSQHRNWAPIATWAAAGFASLAASAGANAVDWHHARKMMDEAWEWAIRNPKLLDVAHLIYWPSWSVGPLQWTPAAGVRPYSVPSGGSYHDDHIHFTAAPSRSGPDRC